MGLWFSEERQSANLGPSCNDEKMLKCLILFSAGAGVLLFHFILGDKETENICKGQKKNWKWVKKPISAIS